MTLHAPGAYHHRVGAFVAAFDELSRRVVSLSSTSGALPGHLRAMTGGWC